MSEKLCSDLFWKCVRGVWWHSFSPKGIPGHDASSSRPLGRPTVFAELPSPLALQQLADIARPYFVPFRTTICIATPPNEERKAVTPTAVMRE